MTGSGAATGSGRTAIERAVIERVAARDRYLVSIDGQKVGMCVYHDEGNVRVVTHTEVRGEFEGEGLGTRLVRFALDDIRSVGMRVRPLCPMVAAYIERHQEYADLVA